MWWNELIAEASHELRHERAQADGRECIVERDTDGDRENRAGDHGAGAVVLRALDGSTLGGVERDAFDAEACAFATGRLKIAKRLRKTARSGDLAV